jgi:hypothetical protein
MQVNCHLLSENQQLISRSFSSPTQTHSSANAPTMSIYNRKPNKSSLRRALSTAEFLNEIAFPEQKDVQAPLGAFK